MKCPKCGYLGFESGDRCRNCGYDFSLAPPAPAALDLAFDREAEQPRRLLDLERIIGEEEGGDAAGDLPLIHAPSRPRPPLGVRRATPEVPRARPRAQKPTPPREDSLFEAPPVAIIGPSFSSESAGAGEPLATPSTRIMAALVDAALLSSLDAIVLYLTLRLCGLRTVQLAELPTLPLAAFFLLLNGGYFVAFTAVGGQSIGKMALGIKVITQEDESVPLGRAAVRTLAYLLSALPLGAGFVAGLIGADRLALHDRLAHTRVVRPS